MEKGNEPTIKSGDKLKEIETNEIIKKILIDFLRGYPIWRYWGIFESYFGEKVGKEIIQKLDDHKIIEVFYAKKEDEKTSYSLAPKGVEIAIAMTNLDYSKKMIKLTNWIRGLTIAMLIGIGMQIYLAF